MLISFLENLLFECYLLYRIILDCFNLNRTMICHELSVSKFLLSFSLEIGVIVFNCGVFLILENEVNGIHNNKTTISLTLYYALVSKKKKKISSDIVAATTQAAETQSK